MCYGKLIQKLIRKGQVCPCLPSMELVLPRYHSWYWLSRSMVPIPFINPYTTFIIILEVNKKHQCLEGHDAILHNLEDRWFLTNPLFLESFERLWAILTDRPVFSQYGFQIWMQCVQLNFQAVTVALVHEKFIVAKSEYTLRISITIKGS